MKGYKGFSKGLICIGKQYAENTVFEEDNAVICKQGMHFCENPLDVLDYYPLLADNAEPNEFAEVEALSDVKTDNGKKFCTTKLKVGAKLTVAGFVEAAVAFALKKNKGSEAASGYGSKLAASGDYSKLAASGNYSQLAASGDDTKLATSGDGSQLAASGNYSQLAASGDNSQLAASGYGSKLAASGDYSQLAASGNYSQLATSGYGSKLAASGDGSKLAASGDYSVVAGIGIDNRAKAALGCWITLAEWKRDNDIGRYIPVCVKTERVDGERIKADTWYKLVGGEFVEQK